jgi:hypothetical protein
MVRHSATVANLMYDAHRDGADPKIIRTLRVEYEAARHRENSLRVADIPLMIASPFIASAGLAVMVLTGPVIAVVENVVPYLGGWLKRKAPRR